MESLRFAPFSSAVETGFWHKLTQKKLDVYGLDDGEQQIKGFYFNGDSNGLPSRLNVDFTAFDVNKKCPPKCFLSHGYLHNKNTINDFKSCDKKTLLDKIGKKLWSDITSGAAIDNPSLLSVFLQLTFADLKKYHFYYLFAFPALSAPENIKTTISPQKINQHFTEKQVASFIASYNEFQTNCVDGFFLLINSGQEELQVKQLKDFKDIDSANQKVTLGFCDPCTLDGHPGWPLRNLLTLAAYHWSSQLGELVEVLCFRDRYKNGVRDFSHSIVLTISLPSISSITECPRCVGWEKNEKNQFGPRMANLSSSMDPTRLAESSVDLNLKLMRWRLLPQLDLDKTAKTKCLLLGAGTLGCNVARCLLGWGVRQITFVDNGTVSYSNPVRQSLFVFEDCLDGGKNKAEQAADSLKKIFPGVISKGYKISIPMPGHSVSEKSLEQTRKDVETLEHLVDEHDVVFLLMDTRESRWLPTLLGASKHKIVINAALGFDTFLVVRHGLKMNSDADVDTDQNLSLSSQVPGHQLGCYFCNDVVAPGDSTQDRTLDQQCTVSRPGMSMVTSALAVELLVSLLQHPDGGYAVSDSSTGDEHLVKDAVSPLGLVPHQIRGFLSRYHQILPATRAFSKCTACSKIVCDEYKKEGFSFLLNAFNNSTYLEDLTGLTQLHMETNDDEVWELSDEDTDDSQLMTQ